jgi:DNA-binding MarR family transcriptional regulator
MEQPDPLIHQPVRLKILSALRPLPEGEMLEFVRLKDIVAATEGNLGAHLSTLEAAHYIAVAKDFAGKRPRTRVRLTTQGRRAFEDYIAYLRRILEIGT